jgi:histidinol-phosphate aminotransferase
VSRVHGGPDARGAARWDFSTNANAAGPCPFVLEALRQADPTRYPDPGYHRLREQLGAWHGVAPSRILIAASASEFIQRITAVSARLTPGPVQVPLHAYGDYAAAAHAHGRRVVIEGQGGGERPTLRWCADPSSPLGEDSPPPANVSLCTTVLDAVYGPLRLEGRSAWGNAARDAVFELLSPNKALGVPGVRAAYAIAPRDDGAGNAASWCAALVAAEPSWPIGAHGVALLEAWMGEATQRWLAEQRPRLREWKRTLVQLLQDSGAVVRPSVTPFVCARLPAGLTPQTLRNYGIGVRDATSFGLPAWVRLSAQPPASLQALGRALQDLRDHTLLTTESR